MAVPATSPLVSSSKIKPRINSHSHSRSQSQSRSHDRSNQTNKSAPFSSCSQNAASDPAPSSSSSSSPASSSSTQRQKQASVPNLKCNPIKSASNSKPMHQHHPYRIELLDITPVSVSLIWSIRPPPISAIPRDLAKTPLRHRILAKTPTSSNNASPSSSHSVIASSPLAKHEGQSPDNSSAYSSANHSSRASPTLSAPAQYAGMHPSEATAHRLTEGLVATRSLNRKVTKIRLRGTSPAASAFQSSQHVRSQSSAISSSLVPHDEDWPSDEGSTAVEEDRIDRGDSASESSEFAEGRDKKTDPSEQSIIAALFESEVSVVVNGEDWPHVLMGERGSDEAIVVIFGFQPEQEYDIQFIVGKEAVKVESALARVRNQTGGEAKRVNEPLESIKSLSSGAHMGNRSRSSSPSRPTLKSSTMDANANGESSLQEQKAALQANHDASVALRVSLTAELKKARKETSKAEGALRNEIEAVKRGLDRMSGADHRSKQKVLALQESVRQATIHAREINEEAEALEAERQSWEEKESSVQAELEELRKRVEEEELKAKKSIEEDELAVQELEKELKELTAALKARQEEKESLKDKRLPELEAEIAKVKSQIVESLNKPFPHRGQGLSGPNRQASRLGPTQVHHFVPTQAFARPRGLNGLGQPSNHPGRVPGRSGHGVTSNRASSGPAYLGVPQPQPQPQPQPPLATQPFPTAVGFRGFQPGGGPTPSASAPRSFMPLNAGRPEFVPGAVREHASTPSNPILAGPLGPSSTNSVDHSQVPAHGFASSSDDVDFLSGYFNPLPSSNLTAMTENSSSTSPSFERRSSLPFSQTFGRQTMSNLNPNNPEFVPASASAQASPVLPKGSAAHQPTTRISLPPPSLTPPAALNEHSPTTSSRFAFPLARNQAKAPAATPSLIGSDRSHGSLSTAPISSGSHLFPGTQSGSSFGRGSPLQGSACSGASTSPLIFSNNSPQFGHASAPLAGVGLISSAAQADQSQAPLSGKLASFGPLDYDSKLDGFGPAPSLGTGSVFGPQLVPKASPFSASPLPTIFGSDSTWTPPTGVGTTASMSSTSAMPTSSWVAPSPPLGNSLGIPGAVPDIWSNPLPLSSGAGGALAKSSAAHAIRNRPSLGEIGSGSSGLGRLRAGNGLGSIGLKDGLEIVGPGGRLSSASRFMNGSAPVSPTYAPSSVGLSVPPGLSPKGGSGLAKPENNVTAANTTTKYPSSPAGAAGGPKEGDGAALERMTPSGEAQDRET
ncbi:hypothetical protein IE53DRAFT_87042 [Violaceomyces palustris]|uniref:Uncharacterized protein n=1 Tax=Violaceomyces palustris TaxID=1673888 RepID=A0ACD0NXN8_9BASI|nr:hypothetical protein IE53DRAFT_87042 [Violaceomyces palustris]